MFIERMTWRGRRSAASLVFLAFATAACAQPAAAPAGLTDADRAAIAAARAAAETAANAGDIAAWGAGYADDAVVMGPNAPAVSGKAAIMDALKMYPPLSNAKFTETALEGSGDWAWAQGTYSMTMTPPGAAAIEDRGKFLEVWRKQADGSWRLYRDMYNSDLPMPGAPAP